MAVHRYSQPAAGPYRQTRDQLDYCLNAVEEAIEKGEEVVSQWLANCVRPLVPSVEPGMPLTQALEFVFSRQQRLFSGQGVGVEAAIPDERLTSRASGESVPLVMDFRNGTEAAADTCQPPITEAEAQDITFRIKRGMGELPMLLLEAHNRRAWIPIGHHSWEQYVRVEFRLSRSRSYELLDQARAVLALQQAAGNRPLPPISALAAIEIKPYLLEVAEEVRHQLDVEAAPTVGTRIDVIVRQALDRARARAREKRKNGRHSPTGPMLLEPSDLQSPVERQAAFRRRNLRLLENSGPAPTPPAVEPEAHTLLDVVSFLANRAPAAEIVSALSESEIEQLDQLPLAARWLNELLKQWALRRSFNSLAAGVDG